MIYDSSATNEDPKSRPVIRLLRVQHLGFRHFINGLPYMLSKLRDSIRGYKSLLKDGKILPQDIYKNNIIMTRRTARGEQNGR